MRPSRSRSVSRPKEAPRRSAAPWSAVLDDLNPRCAGAFRAGLDLERDLLAALQAVEVGLGTTPVEEVLFAVLGRDEPEAAVAYELFDGAILHGDLLISRTS